MTPRTHISAETWENQISSFVSRKPKKPLLVLLGPTASGKTDLSIRIAKSLQKIGQYPEVVNADSRQMYRFMDIGTAKMSEQEMQGVPHHLLSVLDPKEELTIARYQILASASIDDIHARGGLPMLVGGSMLYISAIIDGLQPISTDPALRAHLSAEYDKDNGETLHRRLLDIDPESAATISRENKVYVLRALEIFESTGAPKSSQKILSACPYDLLIFGIDVDPEVLKERINKRTTAMFAAGWFDEVRELRDRGYSERDPGMKSHGYRDILECLEHGGDPVILHEKIAAQTRQYAKRQRTWWRGDDRIMWVKI